MIAKVKSWIRSHKVASAILLLLAIWYVVRPFVDKVSGGHDTPEQARADGWAVWPAGITGWKETPNDGGGREFWHMTGWDDGAIG